MPCPKCGAIPDGRYVYCAKCRAAARPLDPTLKDRIKKWLRPILCSHDWQFRDSQRYCTLASVFSHTDGPTKVSDVYICYKCYKIKVIDHWER